MKCRLDQKKILLLFAIVLLFGVLMSGVLKVSESFTSDSGECTSVSDIRSKIPTNGFALVKCYAPWCGYCKRLVPEWEKLKAKYKNNSKVKILAIDCDKYKDAGEELDVTGYPTIKLMRKMGPAKDYNGGRSLIDFKKFIEEHM